MAGEARGRVSVMNAPLSFWGGIDATSGVVIDRRHPQVGVCITGTMLLLPSGRGSSSSSTVLAEAMRLGTAPAAVVLAEADDIVALGVLVAQELYGKTVPVVVVAEDDWRSISRMSEIEISPDGRIRGR